MRRFEKWRWTLSCSLPGLGATLYLTRAWFRNGTLGYPLDDGWIHQVFARSLALRGEMSFNPGELSAGSTAPLWSALLTPGHWLGAPILWSYVLGVATLALSGWLTWLLAGRLFPARPAARWLAAGILLLEWHIVWASVSGMETLLFTALSLGLVLLTMIQMDDERLVRALAMGLLGGMLCLTRPGGVLLVGLVGLDMLRRRQWAHALCMGMACLVAVSPGLWINWRATGGVMPDTYAAKSVYVARFGLRHRFVYAVMAVVALGAGSLLLTLPGAIWAGGRSVRVDWRRHWLPVVWPTALFGLYLWRLPLLYHHVRYLMPTIPWLALYGAAAFLSIRPRRRRRFLLAVNAAVLLIFWIQGANTYSWNADNIESQHVAIGDWLAEFDAGRNRRGCQ